MLNRLQRLLPEGLLADAAWFTRMGYSGSLRARYLASGWLESVAWGVYRRPAHRPGLEATTPLRWQHVVVSLQAVMESPVAVGGRTALELAGLAHYTSSGLREVHLYGDRPVPGWLGRLPIETDFVFHNARRLFRDEPVAHALQALRAVLQGGGTAAGNRSMGACNGSFSAMATGHSCSPPRNGRFWSCWTSFRRGRPSIRPTC